MGRAWHALLAGLVLAGVGAGTVLAGDAGWLTKSLVGRGHSMSHGPEPLPGVLDDGDLGRYRWGPGQGDITSMVAARAAGAPGPAGDFGDVVMYRPNGEARPEAGRRVLVEHRVLVWVELNASSGRFDAPELGLASVSSVTIPEVGTWDPALGYVRRSFTLHLVVEGPEGLSYPAGRHSGWVTKGDHNPALDQDPRPGGPAVSQLVQPAWVEAQLVGVVDADSLVRDVALGVAAALVLGSAAVVAHKRLRRRGGARAVARDARPPRPRCGACREPWGELPFCARCGAVPPRRSASPQERGVPGPGQASYPKRP